MHAHFGSAHAGNIAEINDMEKILTMNNFAAFARFPGLKKLTVFHQPYLITVYGGHAPGSWNLFQLLRL